MTRSAVAIVGAGAIGMRVADGLLQANIDDFVVLDHVPSSVFHGDTYTWASKMPNSDIHICQVIIAAHVPLQVPWIPDLPGRDDFAGVSFHSAVGNPAFDPTGKHIAVVGGDAAAGLIIDRLITSAASVKVFTFSPRRIVGEVSSRRSRAKRRLRRYVLGAQRPTPVLVRTPVDTVTASGIRTCDGVHHDVDAIVYGTGFAVPETVNDETLVGADGLTIGNAWHDGIEPYFGVAVHGFPNYFLVTGPEVQAQIDYVIDCLQYMQRTCSARIEVRRSSQQVFNDRMHLRPPMPQPVSRAFDLSASPDLQGELYHGSATLTIAGTSRQVPVRLTGHLDPIDGQYHWRGTIFDHLSADLLKPSRQVTLAIGELSAAARIAEQTPWGTHSIAGVGIPPFARQDVTVAMPYV